MDQLQAKIGKIFIRIARMGFIMRDYIAKLLNWLNRPRIRFTMYRYISGRFGIILLIMGVGVLGAALYPKIKHMSFDESQNMSPATSSIKGIIEPLTMQPVEEIGTLAPPDHALTTKTIKVEKGTTLDGLLANYAIPATERHKIFTAMRPYFSPRSINQNHILTLRVKEDQSFFDLSLEIDPTQKLWVRYDENKQGYYGEIIPLPTFNQEYYKKGVIETSLYVDAIKQGVSAKIITDMIRLFSFDVDFQRGIRKGDQFKIFYDEDYNARGERVGSSGHNIKMASLILSGKEYLYYLYHSKATKEEGYFSPEGKTARKGLLRTPVDGARLSSHYGMRKHPILGYNKMHKGTDFAAPTGTHIYAAGDGVIEYVGRNGGYGKYIRIRHNNGYKTAYAHLHKYAKGMRKGARVNQYQVIGYVGSTGRSTGPHLHYEIIRNGKHVNPMKVKMPTSMVLKGTDLTAFKQEKAKIDAKINQKIAAIF